MGERRALIFSQVLLYISYASLIACVLLHILPVYALLALLTAIAPIRIYRSLQPENPSEAYLPLMGASQRASVRCGVIMAAALLIQGLFY
ncbi:hypothetical protein ACFTAO_44600 [Paenibacillus rhizoplanae]